MTAKRKASELKKISPAERKKLTNKVVMGANALQRKLVERFEDMKRQDRDCGTCGYNT